MARQARRAANLVPGASLRGLVFDGCYINRIPHTFGMLRHFGLPNRNRVLVSESPHLNTAGLAAALRIDESEVLSRRYPAVGRGHCDFFGLHVMKARIEDQVRRFSPAAIANGVHYHPATHELRDLPFSTIGWDQLRDTCDCENEGVRQNWVTTNGSSRCHSCGGSLGRLRAVPVPHDLRPALELIAQLVDPDTVVQVAARAMLPADIRDADRTLLYDIIMNLARVQGADAGTSDFDTRIHALAAACQALISWPTGLDLIERAADCPTDVWEWTRKNYAILDVASGTARPQAPSSQVSASHAVAAYSPSGSKGRFCAGLLSAMAAARLGGVDEQALKQAWDDGRFTQHVWALGPNRTRAFDPDEVIAVAPTLRVAGCRAMAARHIGVPIYGLEQLLEADLFSPAAPTSGAGQAETHMNAARDLAARLEAFQSAVTEPAILLLEAIRHVSGRPKPWGAVVEALLGGTIPFAVVDGIKKSGLLGRIVVARAAIPDIVGMPHDPRPLVAIERADHWSGVDALECLNGNRSAAELLEGIEGVGKGRRRHLPVLQVLQRAASGVTTFDLTRRSGMGTTRVAAVLASSGVGQIAPGLWERPTAEKLILRVPPATTA